MTGPSIEEQNNILGKDEESTKREILPRALISNYFSLNGLQQLTGEPIQRFNIVVPNELLGNSIDICDEKYSQQQIKDVNIELCVEKAFKNFVRITVKDNGWGWDEKDVRKICDLTHFYSSRTLYRYVTIGLVGHAYKIIPGAANTLAREIHETYDESPITITSKGKRYELDVQYDGQESKVNLKISDIEKDEWSSKVSVLLPACYEEWLTDKGYLEKFEQYVVANPHVNFSYKGLSVEKHYKKICELKVAFRESILDFDEETFIERTIAEKDKETNLFTSGFRDCSKLQLTEFPKHLNEFSDEQRKQLYQRIQEYLKRMNKKATATVLAPLALGRDRWFKRIDQVCINQESPGLLSNHCNSNYKSMKDIATFEDKKRVRQGIPFLVEVAVKAFNGLHKRVVNVVINRGPRPDDGILDYAYTNIIKGKTVNNISGILDHVGIAESDPVTVWIHLISPNVPFSDLGKTQILVQPFAFTIAKTVKNASCFYRSLKKKCARSFEDKTNDESIAHYRATIKQKVFQELPAVVEVESNNDKLFYPARNAWYKLRERFEKKGWSTFVPEYDPYFTPTLTEQFRREYPDGKKILAKMLKERSGSLQEPRSHLIVPIDTENVEKYQLPKWKYNKILYIEKNGFTGLIVANHFHEMFDLAVMAGRGEGSFGARDILKKIKKMAEESGQKMSLYTVHDADFYGLGISVTFKHGSYNDPEHNLEIIDLGLTISDGKKWHLTPEKVPWPKNKDGTYRKLPEKISKYLPKELGEITDAGWDNDGNRLLNRIELNAFTPKEFLEWLTAKLEEHDDKAKVRPPDDVVKTETLQTAEHCLEESIENELWNRLGGKEQFMKALKDQLKNHWRGTEKDPDNIDVRKSMDEQLAKFPVEGWNDIIKKDVEEKIKTSISADEKQIIFDQMKKQVS